jgi:ribosome-associated translation inhibitor RaiA
MNVSIAAHGFDLTDAIKEACRAAAEDAFPSLSESDEGERKVRWHLSLDGDSRTAHISWKSGIDQGDVTVSDPQLYSAIHEAAVIARRSIAEKRERRRDRKLA